MKIFLYLVLFIVTVNSVYAFENAKEYEPKIIPIKKSVVAYYQGGEYPEYNQAFKSLIKSLSNYGWLEPIDLQKHKTSKEIWEYLCKKASSNYLEFKKDAYYNSDWDAKKRVNTLKSIQKRIKLKNDIDFVIALGTWAGQDLSHNNIDKNTFVMGSNDPVGAKIVKDYKSSGYEYLHTRVDKDKFLKQISLFNKIFHFKKMGIVYEDTELGRSIAAVDDAVKTAKKYNFKLQSCIVEANDDLSLQKEELIECYKKLADSSDAIYVTQTSIYTVQDLEFFMPYINKNKIPTFYQGGNLGVKHGILMGVSSADFKYISRFHAQTIAKILNGDALKNQSMYFEDPNILTLNLKTAQNINWDPPIDIIGITKELYYEDIFKKF